MAQRHLRKFKAIVVGGSAGSLEIVLKIAEALPLAGIVCILVVHRRNDPDSALAHLIAAKSKLKVREVEDKETIAGDVIYLAPPDYHLLVETDVNFALDASEKVHFSRPSIDVCFESAAAIYGDALIGVLLSGANADGAAGLKMIRDAGGFCIVQNPATAEVPYMPQQAINQDAADEVVDGGEIHKFIVEMLQRNTPIRKQN
ncbi:MAG: chemotaxis protein CheB [Gemmatimonadaceae bacterium]|nr:chemotaxis protein CheB [Chitinophagaceae bacterium]